MPSERLREYLDEHGVEYERHTHEVAYPAQEVASAEGVSGWLVAKPVMVLADGDLAMIVLAAPMRVALDKAAEALDASEVRLATESEFEDAFPDCEKGAEPPFGNLYDVPTYIDQSLLDDPHIVFRGGTHTETVQLSLADYLRLAEPTRVNVGVPE